MITLNKHYNELKGSYLFTHIAKKTAEYTEKNPGTHLLRLGIGDVTLPLCDAVVRALNKAAEDQSDISTFHGYMPECGADFLRAAIKGYYEKRNVSLLQEEIFVSSGASDELGDILDLFSSDNTALIMEPAYPAYIDANIIAGHNIEFVTASPENEFTPLPDEKYDADIIYLCSPNNPTGAVFSKEKLQKWVDFANARKALIIFDAAYEAFIEDESIPHSIFEIPGSRTCAIEISSLSKTAGFTGTRCGYTVIPAELERDGVTINSLWVRNRTTKTNGVSYIIQRGAEAIFTEEGQRQVHENIAVYKKNAEILMNALDDCSIPYCGGKNAPYIWMKCPEGMSSWELFDLMLEKIQVVGTPGVGFGPAGEGYFRLSSFGRQEDILEAAQRIRLLMKSGI
ncbi:MAG TPA: LL-diaminopimelate aminotransferase [Bacillota bacterium]|nr:LL-diaminopimelate aminotransferase [Bacillota bacterium]